jgi:hypothetical protein
MWVIKVLSIYAIVDVVSMVALGLLLLTDRRWYRNHPGAEEMFARMEREIRASEG